MLVTLEQFFRVLLDPSLCDRCHGQSYEKVAWTFFFSDDDEEHAANVRSNMHVLYAFGHLVFPSWFARSKKNVRSCTVPGSRPPLHVGLPGLIVNWNSWREAREEWSRMSDSSCTLCSRWLLSTHHHHFTMAASKEKKPSVEHPTATQLSDAGCLPGFVSERLAGYPVDSGDIRGRWWAVRYQGLFAVGNIQLCFCIQ